MERILTNHDIVDEESPTAKKMSAELSAAAEKETGWDRLKSMLFLDEFGSVSPEMNGVITTTAAGFLCGSLIGAAGASKTEYINFIDNNKASLFDSHYHAKHELQHRVTKAMMYGGFKVGWRLGLFTGSYMFFTTAVSTYRNKSSVIEYSAGGLLAGAVYKFPMGPKAVISGGLVGGVLGTIAGALSVGIMKLTGTTTEELRYWRKGWKTAPMSEILPEIPLSKTESVNTMELQKQLGLTLNGNESKRENITGDSTQNKVENVSTSELQPGKQVAKDADATQ